MKNSRVVICVVMICSVMLGGLLSGCRTEGNEGGKPAASGAKADAGAVRVKAVKTPAPAAFSKTGKEVVRGNDSATGETTQPTVLISGLIRTAAGDPATSLTVKAISLQMESDGIEAPGTNLNTTVSDVNGRYRLRCPVTGELVVRVSGKTAPMTVPVPLPELKSHEKKMVPVSLDITLLESSDVSGRVTGPSGEGLAGAVVRVYPTRVGGKTDFRSRQFSATTSTAEGKFSLENIAAGDYQLAVVHPDFAPVLQKFAAPTTQPLNLQIVAGGGSVTGRVLRKGTTEPVADVPVRILVSGGTALTGLNLYNVKSGPDGGFRFDHVMQREARLYVPMNKDSLWGLSAPVPPMLNVKDGETTDVEVFVYGGHTIKGRVFDKDTDDGLEGATVGLPNRGQWETVITDKEGRYEFKPVFRDGSDQHRMKVRLDGYLRVRSDEKRYEEDEEYYFTTDLPAETVEVTQDIPMVKLLTIRGTVLTDTGKAVPGATVQLSSAWARRFDVKPDGTFEIAAAPFSSVGVMARAEGYAPAASPSIETTTLDIDGVNIVLKPGATILGRVVNEAGEPVSNANVFASEVPGQVTDKAGQFTLQDVPETFWIGATHTDYVDSGRQDLELAPGEKRAVTLVLRTPQVISGHVSKADGTPAEGVSVMASGMKLYGNGRTDAQGNFEIKKLAEGTYKISTIPASKEFFDVKSGTKDLEIVLEDSSVKTKTSYDNTLIGTVVDDISGAPVKDFEVRSQSGRVEKLDEPGKFRLKEMADGRIYTLSISGPGYMKQEFPSHTAEGGKTIEQTFKLSKGGAITGRLVGKKSKKPLPGVVVVNWGGVQTFDRDGKSPENHCVTDAEGRFTLAPVKVGGNYVLVKATGPYSEFGETVKVVSEQTAEMGDIELSSGGTISGRVVKGAEEEPLAGTEVGLAGKSIDLVMHRQTVTDSEGKFQFEHLPSLNYTVSAQSVSKRTVLEGDKTVDLLLKIGGVKLSGKVRRGGQAAEVYLRGTGPKGVQVEAYSQNGEYTIENVIPGAYSFSILGSNGHELRAPEKFEVADKAEDTHDFELPDGAVDVTVLNASGEPVGNASVALTKKSSNVGVDQQWVTRVTGQSRSDMNGKVHFGGLAAGEYGVTGRKEGEGSAMKPNIKVGDSGSQAVELVLSSEGGTLVSVTLNYTTGQPMSEPWCYLHGESGPFKHKAHRDASGVMTITDVPPGVYTTNVSYWGYSQNAKQVEIKANETVQIEDVLYPAGAVHWTLKKADGSPAVGAQVTVTPVNTDPPEQPRSGVTGGDGKYVERGLAGGTYQLVAIYEGKASPTEQVSVQAGQNELKETVVQGW